MTKGRNSQGFFRNGFSLLKQTGQEFLEDKAPQLGAALAYYTVFSLAPLILVLLAIVGVIFRDDPAGAWDRITQHMSYFLDASAVQVVQNIAQKASHPGRSTIATIIGVALALFGASGVFGQLQDALNTIWDVKAKPSQGIWGFLRNRFLSFGMVAGVCFLLLVSLALESLLKGFSHYVQSVLPGRVVVAMTVYLIFDFAVIVLLFAMMFKFLPDAKIQWRDVWIGAVMTAILFGIGKWLLGLYLGSGAAGSAYGSASSLITLLLWVYYSSQILLFGGEFTQVYADRAGSGVKPDEFERPPAQALSAFSDIKFDYVAKMDVPDLGDMVTAKWIVDWSIPDPAQGGLPEYRKIREMIANKIRSELPQLLAKEPKTKRG